MGLQKYRADEVGETQSNGATPVYTRWMGGPTLALVRKCPIHNSTLAPRTVYVRGEANTWFSIPAACKVGKHTLTGYLTTDDDGCYHFRMHTGQEAKLVRKA